MKKIKNFLIDIIAEAIKKALTDMAVRQKNPIVKWKTPEAAAKYASPEYGRPYHFVTRNDKN